MNMSNSIVLSPIISLVKFATIWVLLQTWAQVTSYCERPARTWCSFRQDTMVKLLWWSLVIRAASSEFGTYRLCEQQRFRRACASAQSRQNLRCSLIQAVNQEELSDRKPDPWPLWMAGHAQLKFVMTECSKTQIRLTGLIWSLVFKINIASMDKIYLGRNLFWRFIFHRKLISRIILAAPFRVKVKFLSRKANCNLIHMYFCRTCFSMGDLGVQGVLLSGRTLGV